MSRIKIKNFGPIKKGLERNEGYINIKKVNVFTGNQGSGKSTVAKLISSLTWIEKAIVRGDIIYDKVLHFEEFKDICSFQGIQNYFKNDSEIHYIGDAIEFHLSDGKIFIGRNQEFQYYFPKIMYVPAERNILGTYEKFVILKDLPGPVFTFAQEYQKALSALDEAILLPINNVSFEVDILTGSPMIFGEDYRIRLQEASSGFHSFIPAYLVTRYLADWVFTQRNISAHSSSISFNLEDEDRLRKRIREILDNPNLSERIKRIQIEEISQKSDYRAFVNILEEPEQNLHPKSQREMLNNLLTYNNRLQKNILLMTSHSPYLINYITLAVKAGKAFEVQRENKHIVSKIEKIVPLQSVLSIDDLAIYEMDEETGGINVLSDLNGIPSDDNMLNEELDEFNDLYAQLVELQNAKN